jgi:hypothetical protein
MRDSVWGVGCMLVLGGDSTRSHRCGSRAAMVIQSKVDDWLYKAVDTIG